MKKYMWLVRPMWDENHPECKQFSSEAKARKYSEKYEGAEIVLHEWVEYYVGGQVDGDWNAVDSV